MPDGSLRAAEEFYSLCLANARTLDQAAHRFARAGDAVGLVACAWGSDVYVVQAVVWERIMVASPAPHRQFFRVADALFAGLRPHRPESEGTHTCHDVLAAARDSLLAACEQGLRGAIRDGWPEIDYAEAVPAPTSDDLAATAAQRLEGLAPAVFVARRREEMATSMNEAQAMRVRGDTAAAIQRAYEADFLGLEAYLVESAIAAGDAELITCLIRWELAVSAVGQLAGLPEGFVAAITLLRDALCAALVEPDANRLRATLLPI